MYEVSEYMLDFIAENNITNEYLEKIQIPKNVLDGIPLKDDSNFEIIVTLSDFLEDLVEQVNTFLWEEIYYKDRWKNVKDVNLATIIKEFNFPLCPFWLTFCELVVAHFSEEVYS